MLQSKKVREECGEKYISVFYDLAIYKLVIRIQEQKSPTFNDLFILQGSFHLRVCLLLQDLDSLLNIQDYYSCSVIQAYLDLGL